MNLIHRLAAICLCTALFAACKKDDDPSRREILTSGNWRMTAFTLSVAGMQQSTGYDTQDPCIKDNLTLFKTDGTVISDEGATKCDPTAAQTSPVGTWELLENDTKFRLTASTAALPIGLPVTGSSLALAGDVLELSSSVLRVKATGSYTYQGFPIPYEVNMSYAK